MSRETLTAFNRDASGKSPVARRLRQTGMTPGILYKAGESLPFSASTLDIAAILRHGAQLVDLDIEGSRHVGMVKTYQVHPVRGTLQHIDLQEVRMDEVVKTTVPIVFVGEARGQKGGGVLTQLIHELNIEATPLNLPDSIDVDISHVDLGQSFHVNEIGVPEGVTVLDDPEALVLNISVPRGASAGEEEEGAEGEGGEDGGAEATGAGAEGGE